MKIIIIQIPKLNPNIFLVCKEGWSQWLDISTPSISKNNSELETFEGLKEQDISVCQPGYISKIECKYQNLSSV